MNIHIYIYTYTPSTAVVKCRQRQASPEVNIYGINQAGLFRGTLMKALTLLTPVAPALRQLDPSFQRVGGETAAEEGVGPATEGSVLM